MMKEVIRIIRKLLLSALIVSLCFNNSACWSKREIDGLGFILGMGFSKTEDGLYLLTVQLANPEALTSENPDQRDIYTILEHTGLSVFDAMRNLSMVAGRRLFFPHLKVLVIDESIAKEGIGEIVGFLKQDEEVRIEHEVLISRVSPREIFDTPNTLGVVPAQALDTMVDNIGANDKIYVADMREVLGVVSNPSLNLATGLVEIIPAVTELEMDYLKITSIAVFDNDKLVDYLDYEEGQAYNFVTGNFFNGLIAFEGREDKRIVIEMLGAESSITPRFSDGKIFFHIEISGEGNIAERIPEGEKQNLDIMSIKEQTDKVIEDKINKAIDKAQNQLKVDYYNLSSHFHRKLPEEFHQLRDNWNHHFSQAEITVSVDIKIIHSALGTYGGQQ